MELALVHGRSQGTTLETTHSVGLVAGSQQSKGFTMLRLESSRTIDIERPFEAKFAALNSDRVGTEANPLIWQLLLAREALDSASMWQNA